MRIPTSRQIIAREPDIFHYDQNVAIDVARRVAVAFTRTRHWIELDEAIAEAYLRGLEEALLYDRKRAEGMSFNQFVGIRVRYRLIDWQRRERMFSARAHRKNEQGHAETYQAQVPWHPDLLVIPHSDIDEEHLSQPAVEEQGYGLVIALDFGRRLRQNQQELDGKIKSLQRRALFSSLARRRAMGDTAGKIVGTHMIYEGQHLTDRELQVLDLASQGLTNREVGAKLGLAQETIKTHVRHYLAKLGARNTTHAVALGYQQGYLPKSTEGRRSA